MYIAPVRGEVRLGHLLLVTLLVFVWASSSLCSAEDVVVINSVALTEFLKRFDVLEHRGFVKTQRAGSTGIGYTLETMLKIEENNSPRGDLPGMEIKAYRDDEKEFDDHEKMNLFLKEPTWVDGKTSAARIRDYG